MIVPMKKVSLIIRGYQKAEALKTLRKLGIVHLEAAEGSGSRLEELKERLSLLENSLFTVSEKKIKNLVQRSMEVSEAIAAAREIAALSEEKKLCASQQITLKTELDRLSGWGEIDPETIEELSEKGIDISLCEMPTSEYGELDDSFKTVCLQKTKTSVKFVLIKSGEEAEEPDAARLKAYRLELPRTSTSELRQSIAEIDERISGIDREISSFADCADGIRKAVKVCEKEIEFETYATGMATEYLSAEGKGNVSVSYITGYIEAENLPKLQQSATVNCWGLLTEEPTEEDNVPTKLKNNKFVSLIYPLTDFLGTVPGYFEYDISGWFLSFILIFFGIIFGDGGYGLLICAVAAVPIIKSLAAKKEVSPVFLLIGLFGLSTIIWGTLTCTWFGLSPEQLPGWLKSLSVPVISNVYAEKLWYPFWTDGKFGLTTAQNLQIFCFSLALFSFRSHISRLPRETADQSKFWVT